MTDFPDLKIRALVNFPANVIGDAGIDVNKTNGTYHLNLAYDDFAPVVTGILDPANQTVLTWNTVTEQYALAPISVLTGSSAEFVQISGVTPFLDMWAHTGALDYGPWIYASMFRGTVASPTIIQQGDAPFGINVYGYNGSALVSPCSIFAIVDDTVSPGSIPMGWVIATGDASPGNVERLRVTSAGSVIIGPSGPFNSVFDDIPLFEINSGITGPNGAIAHNFYGNVAGAADLYLCHSRSDTIGTHTIVQNDDGLGYIAFAGSDGTHFVRGASIYAQVDGIPGSNDMPARLILSTTADGASSETERLRITSAGHSIFTPGSTTPPTLATNGNFVLTPTSNTEMRISYRGTDGVTRNANITLS